MTWYKKGTPVKQVRKNKTLEQRFWAKVDQADGPFIQTRKECEPK